MNSNGILVGHIEPCLNTERAPQRTCNEGGETVVKGLAHPDVISRKESPH